jgi:hypothetical protein
MLEDEAKAALDGLTSLSRWHAILGGGAEQGGFGGLCSDRPGRGERAQFDGGPMKCFVAAPLGRSGDCLEFSYLGLKSEEQAAGLG